VKTKYVIILSTLVIVGLYYRAYQTLHLQATKQPATTLASNQTIKPRTSAPLDDLAKSRWARSQIKASDLFHNKEGIKLTTTEINHFLQEKGSTPLNLIAASRLTGDLKWVREAAQKFPQDATLQLELALKGENPEEKLTALKSFRQLAPENSVGDYLSANVAFEQGDTGSAAEALTQSLESTAFIDYNTQIMQAAEGAYLDAGVKPGIASIMTFGAFDMSIVSKLFSVSQNLKAVQDGFINEADYDSAEPTVIIGLTLGQRMQESSPLLINQLSGMAIENTFLSQLDPLTVINDQGLTAGERIEAIKTKRGEINAVVQGMTPEYYNNLDESVLQQYMDMAKKDELAALKWLRSQK
jgi:hypothetical protein